MTFLAVFPHKQCYSKSQPCSAQKLCIGLVPLSLESICNFIFWLAGTLLLWKNTSFSKFSFHHSIMTIIPSSDLLYFNLTRYVSSLEGFTLINCFMLMWSTFKSSEFSSWKMFCKAAYPKWLQSRVWNSNLIYCKWLASGRCRPFFKHNRV